MKKIIFAVFSCVFTNVFSQKVSDYQYVIVPKQYRFQKSENQYRINSLTKFLFEKHQFSPVWSDNLPEEVLQSPCKALTADIKNNSNLMTTKLILTLSDCKGKIVFTSKEGKSKEKDFTKAFNEALYAIFEDVKSLNYKYIPKEETISLEEKQPEIVETIPPISEEEKNAPVLYAQAIENGYQLVDTTPKVIFKLQKTSLEGLFNAVKEGNINGVFYAQGKVCIFEFSENGTSKKEIYNVKF